MGSWNVQCQISKISISYGDDVVLIPLKQNTYIDTNKYYFMCPPIFGTYNDYGGIENIMEDSSTKILEEYYGESIDVICEAITREKYNPNETEYTSKILRKEISSIKYMWVLRNIWDEFSKLHKNSWSYDDYDMGNPNLLKFLGMEFIGKDESLTRFNKIWKFGDNIFYSDDKWLETSDEKYCYYITDLEKFGINVDSLKNKQDLNFIKTIFRDKLQPKFFDNYSKLFDDNIEEPNDNIKFIENAKHSLSYQFFVPFM